MKFYLQCLAIGLLSISHLSAQKALVFGNVLDAETKKVIDFANVYVEGTNNATETDLDGYFRIEIEANSNVVIICNRLGYKDAKYRINGMEADTKRNINFKLVSSDLGVDVVIKESRIEDIGMVREEVTELRKLPTASGNFESVLPHIALGASSGSGGELSSQYNVRGGNYDENLVYVNDFEVFRPQLIRSGQQEGLTFPNIDLIRDLSFSSGGFQAKYGDKMSSVLDIRYKRPEEFKASIGGSLLGASAHIEGSKRIGANSYNKLRYLVGARYKTNRYLLGSLDVQGEYTPNFTDIQAYVTYDITRDLQIGVIGNYNSSQYDFIPTSRTTALGLIDFALQLSTVFEGQEVNQFNNGMGGLSLTFIPQRDENPLYLKLLASRYLGEESETFDIQGYYRLSQIETSLGSDNAGEEIALLGTGTQHIFARNFLYNEITNVQHKGGIEFNADSKTKEKSHFVQWGAKWQNELIDDELNEWERIDSAGYSLPYSSSEVLLNSVLKTKNSLQSNRFSGFLQNTYSVLNEDESEFKLTGGVRAAYWDLNNELIISPRIQALYKPVSDKNISYKLAAGVYYQPAFYRELRRVDGTVNTDLKSQKSTHIVAGMTYDFIWEGISKKPFKLITELYYKRLDNLVSYEVDNVRIRYSGENDATGYITGLDLRINGEFVPGAESWVNISLLSARERLNGVQHQRIEAGDSTGTAVNYVRRPTDRLFNINMFFQDYLPANNNFKVNLNLSVGGGLPFGLKDNNIEFRNTFNFKPYHRVDIGFAYHLWNISWLNEKPKSPFRFTENAWLSLEVFNLLDVSNVASNTWIKTIFNNQFAIPNYLTSRRINLRLKLDF